MSSNPPNYPNYSSNLPDYPNYSKDDQKKQNMQSSNPTDYQNYSAAYSTPPPSALQSYPPPQHAQQPYQPQPYPPPHHAQQSYQPQPYPPPQYAQQPYQPQPSPSAAPPYDGQPVSGIPVYGSSPRPWSTGLFGCFEDVPNCFITSCCPCITFGQIAEIVDKGANSCALTGIAYALVLYFTACPCLCSCFYRSKLRSQFALEESPCPDCCAHFFCEPCALCQEYRELKKQGFDMYIGWEGNLEKKRREMTMAPIAQGGMTR